MDNLTTKKIDKPHVIVLQDNSTINAISSLLCEDRYCDGVDWLYFETKEKYDNATDIKVYHEWKLTDGGTLTGYLIPVEYVAGARAS